MMSLRKVILFVVAYCIFVLDIKAQSKPNLYILFKEDAGSGVFKRSLSELGMDGHHNEYLYDIYLHVASDKKYQFSTKNGTKAFIVDQSYVTHIHPKSISWLRGKKGGLWPTWSKKFSCKHLYLVEKLTGIQYEITEVETFIGEDF